jgi:hypothetical protein
MRMRDILQMLKNISSNVKITLDPKNGFLPTVVFDSKGILDLHANSIWLVNVISEGFIQPRIMHEDLAHEFKFVQPSERGIVCREAFEEAAAAVKQGKQLVTGVGSTEFAIIDLLSSTENILVEASKSVITDVNDYNNWILSTGGDADEKMSEQGHLNALLKDIQNVRLKALPLWSFLIDLLPDSTTKTQAEEKLLKGCRTVGLDTQQIILDWQIAPTEV